MLTSHVKNSLFFSSESICQVSKKQQTTAKRGKWNWNEANIESAYNMCREGKSTRQAWKPVECQKLYIAE